MKLTAKQAKELRKCCLGEAKKMTRKELSESFADAMVRNTNQAATILRYLDAAKALSKIIDVNV